MLPMLTFNVSDCYPALYSKPFDIGNDCYFPKRPAVAVEVTGLFENDLEIEDLYHGRIN